MSEQPKRPEKELKSYERMFLGGIGAMAPVILNLLVVDIPTTLSSMNKFTFLGYIIRVSVLFGLGAFVAYLHSDDNNKLKLFEFGVAAPAMLVAALNGSTVASQHSALPNKEPSPTVFEKVLDGFVGTAHAQTEPSSLPSSLPASQPACPVIDCTEIPINPLSSLYLTRAQEFVRGLVGQSTNSRNIFVVVGIYSNIDEAKKVACIFRAKPVLTPDKKFEIYEIGSGSYAVAVQSDSYQEAKQISSRILAYDYTLKVSILGNFSSSR